MLATGFTVEKVSVASALPTNVVETLKCPSIERHLNYVAQCDASIRKFLYPYKKFAFRCSECTFRTSERPFRTCECTFRSTERRFLLCKCTISTVFLWLFR